MSNDETQEYLRTHPWLWAPYEAARQLERDIPDLFLQPGLSENELVSLDARIPIGDAPPWGGRPNMHKTPGTYLEFLRLVGGFSYDRLWLSREPFSVFSQVTERRSAPTMGHTTTFEVYFPVRLTLGYCDHGYYLFDTRWNNYVLVGYDRTTYFDNCIGMLLHAMWRARENYEGR